MKYNIYVVSDSIGETAEQVVKAAVSQFKDLTYEIKRHSYLSQKHQIDAIVNEAKDSNAAIAFTLVVEELRDELIKASFEAGVPTIDLLSSIIGSFSDIFDQQACNEPGLIRKLDEKYFRRVEAIEFAVKYDDGKNMRGIQEADVVIIGVSRTSKTPLCMYLANKNIKAANIPLVPEVAVPDELFNVDKRKIVGLTTNPIMLNEIRMERLKALGLKNDANYASLERILKEIDYAEGIMKKVGCPIIDVSTKAVEETSNIIFDIIRNK